MKRLDTKKWLVSGSLLLLLAACAGPSQLRMTRGAAAPAATGTVHLSNSDNGNTVVRLVVEHLAPADRVSPGSSTYMVWTRGVSRGDAAQAMGALAIDSDLDGEIRFVSPMREFDILVTPEVSSEVTAPMGAPVLSTRVRMR
jgi:hypothetical protein